MKAIKLIDYFLKFKRASFRSSRGRGVGRLLVIGNRDALVKGRSYYREFRYRESRVYVRNSWKMWLYRVSFLSWDAQIFQEALNFDLLLRILTLKSPIGVMRYFSVFSLSYIIMVIMIINIRNLDWKWNWLAQGCTLSLE